MGSYRQDRQVRRWAVVMPPLLVHYKLSKEQGRVSAFLLFYLTRNMDFYNSYYIDIDSTSDLNLKPIFLLENIPMLGCSRLRLILTLIDTIYS
jgi:hypothetical protein